jgi:RNA polymerase sigma-70 factor, ECF subfamily
MPPSLTASPDAAGPSADRGSGSRGPDEQDLVDRVKRGDLSGFELLMRRNNQRLYRVIRSVLRQEAEVEDAMQETYCSAFMHLDQWQGRAKFSTWLLKIGVNEALARARRKPIEVLDEHPEAQGVMERASVVRNPEEQAGQREMVAIVEAALDRLPPDHRQVFVLRVVESLDTAESAEVLGISEAAVKQRLHRAREVLQGQIEAQVGTAVAAAFGFLGQRCDRIVAGVMARIARG